MVEYDMDISNAILSEQVRDRSAGKMLKAHNAMVKKMHQKDIRPTLVILDNKCSGNEGCNQRKWHEIPVSPTQGSQKKCSRNRPS